MSRSKFCFVTFSLLPGHWNGHGLTAGPVSEPRSDTRQSIPCWWRSVGSTLTANACYVRSSRTSARYRHCCLWIHTGYRYGCRATASQLERQRKVVVIIDEYDAPLLDVLYEEKNWKRSGLSCRSFMRLSKRTAHIYISPLSRELQNSHSSASSAPSINLANISMDPEFSTICGITKEELDTIIYDKYGDRYHLGRGVRVIL